MNEETPWIWNKGIAALCDHRLPDDFPRGVFSNHENSSTRSKAEFYASMAAKVTAADLVWVKPDWLPFFVSEILPDIEVDFILVTGDSISSIPSDIPRESALILNSPRVMHWFAQNFDGTIPGKISPIPVGMDFHTIQQKDYWGIKRLPVAKQHEVLEMIRHKLEPVGKRKCKLYIDSQFSERHEPCGPGVSNDLTRAGLFQQIHTDPAVHLQHKFLPQYEMWMQRGQFAYVLSHHGVGLDCHRSWEALILGHVLIVQKSSLDPLYRGLPVIIVDDWREIEPLSIGEKLNIDPGKKYQLEKLTNRYWIEKMRDLASQVMGKSELKK